VAYFGSSQQLLSRGFEYKYERSRLQLIRGIIMAFAWRD